MIEQIDEERYDAEAKVLKGDKEVSIFSNPNTLRNPKETQRK